MPASRSRSRSRSGSKGKSDGKKSRSQSPAAKGKSDASAGKGDTTSPKPRSPAPKGGDRERDATPPNVKIARVTVQNLTRNVGSAHLKEIFGTFGEVKEAVVEMDERKRVPKGTAHVEYQRREEAEQAIAAMDGAQIDGNVISVRFQAEPLAAALPPPPHRPVVRTKTESAQASVIVLVIVTVRVTATAPPTATAIVIASATATASVTRSVTVTATADHQQGEHLHCAGVRHQELEEGIVVEEEVTPCAVARLREGDHHVGGDVVGARRGGLGGQVLRDAARPPDADILAPGVSNILPLSSILFIFSCSCLFACLSFFSLCLHACPFLFLCWCAYASRVMHNCPMMIQNVLIAVIIPI